jgi:hypothetical protein
MCVLKPGIMPRSVDREVVETMHRTHIGRGRDYKNVIKQGCAPPWPTGGADP